MCSSAQRKLVRGYVSFEHVRPLGNTSFRSGTIGFPEGQKGWPECRDKHKTYLIYPNIFCWVYGGLIRHPRKLKGADTQPEYMLDSASGLCSLPFSQGGAQRPPFP